MSARYVRRANDDALEYLILIARWFALLVALAGFVCLALAILVSSARLTIVACLALLLAAGSGWFGWVRYGNDVWRTQYASEPGACGIQYNDLICTEPLGVHEHWDKVRDPAGRRKWN